MMPLPEARDAGEPARLCSRVAQSLIRPGVCSLSYPAASRRYRGGRQGLLHAVGVGARKGEHKTGICGNSCVEGRRKELFDLPVLHEVQLSCGARHCDIGTQQQLVLKWKRAVKRSR
jgi:hypothetical protein